MEWPDNQTIDEIHFDDGGTGATIKIGRNGITKIEPIMKSGEYAAIPYVRVWVGNRVHSEFCQHKLIGVFF